MENYWKIEDTPDLSDKIAIVTGANTGLGYETALALAKKNVEVIMACRSIEKAKGAKQRIIEQNPNARLEILKIDLSDLSSVKEFAQLFNEKYTSLDILINNAGVMIPPYSKTKDGFELQMGANYFGHFLLTGLLLDKLEASEKGRIITLSSIAHKSGKINFSDINWEKSYSRGAAYNQSKLACLMFALTLQEKLANAKYNTISLAAHPGVSTTDLSRHIPKIIYWLLSPLAPLLSHSPYKGALPTLMAALDSNAKGGGYYGPTGFMEMKGKPGSAKIENHAQDKTVANKLFDLSENMTNFKYPI